MNGVQTRFKCKLDVKRCKRFVFPPSSLLPRSNALKTKAIRYFQTDRTLTRIVSPPLNDYSQPLAFFVAGSDYKDRWWKWQQTINVRVSAGVNKIAIIQSLQKTMEKFTPGHDFNFRFMDEVLDANYRNELRFTKQILLFSLIAIAISLTGVFGLTMFESEYRRKEIGIRKIMGSSTKQILYMFNRRYILILTGCFIVAAPFGWWIGQHWLQGFAEKTPVTPWIFILSFLLVTLITMTTITVQSWKNANENPVNSIKTE